MGRARHRIWKLEYEGELEITTASPHILLKIQILSSTQADATLYRSRISRLDMFSLRPFTQPEEVVHEWFVVDDSFEVREFEAAGLSEAVELTIQVVEGRLENSMTLDKEDEWRSACLKLATDFSEACREIQTDNPDQATPTIDVVIADLATELWDQGFSQTEIRRAFQAAMDALPAYAAGHERRN